VIGRKYIGFENFDDFRKILVCVLDDFFKLRFFGKSRKTEKTGRKFISDNPSRKPSKMIIFENHRKLGF
jgi:hypothetical protein